MVGALLGSVFSGWYGRVRRQGMAVLVAVASWGAAVAVFGLTRNLWLGLCFLALAGCADTVSMVFRNTMLQSAAPDDMRGRLQGVFLVVVVGGSRLGDFLAGDDGRRLPDHRRRRRRPGLHRRDHAHRALPAQLRLLRLPPPGRLTPAGGRPAARGHRPGRAASPT